MRIYRVPFRRLDEEQQYRKYDWIECRLVRNQKDPRPETCQPIDQTELVPVDHMDTAHGWSERRKLLLKTARVFDNLEDLITGAKRNQLSLAIFKPTRVLDFKWESEERNWDVKKLKEMRELYSQLDLFEDNAWRRAFEVIPKLPYSFSYKFVDANARQSELQVLDWEVGLSFGIA